VNLKKIDKLAIEKKYRFRRNQTTIIQTKQRVFGINKAEGIKNDSGQGGEKKGGGWEKKLLGMDWLEKGGTKGKKQNSRRRKSVPSQKERPSVGKTLRCVHAKGGGRIGNKSPAPNGIAHWVQEKERKKRGHFSVGLAKKESLVIAKDLKDPIHQRLLGKKTRKKTKPKIPKVPRSTLGVAISIRLPRTTGEKKGKKEGPRQGKKSPGAYLNRRTTRRTNLMKHINRGEPMFCSH